MIQQDLSFLIIPPPVDLDHLSSSPPHIDLNTGNICQKNEQEKIFNYLDLKEDFSPRTDLNKGNNCAQNSISRLLQTKDRSILHDESKLEEIIDYFSQKYNYNKDKLLKVLTRLAKKDRCGHTGYVAYVKNLANGDTRLEYIPHSCGCESCAYCSVRKRKSFFIEARQRLEYYIEKGEQIDFFTITYGRVESSKFNEVYEDFMKKLRKLYSYKLTKRKIQKWKEYSYKELKLYLLNIKDERKREEKRIEHTYLIEETFRKIWESFERGAKRFYELFKYMFLKIEITCRNSSYHIHAHGVVVNSISRFVWLSLLKQIGFGRIFDIRRVRSVKKIVSYLSKYLLKSDEVEFDSLEHEIVYEYVLYRRRKLREWGGDDFKKEENEIEYEEEIVYVLKLQLEIDLRKPLSELRKNEFGLRYIGGEFVFRDKKYYMLVDEYGRFVLEEEFFKQIEEGIMMDVYPVLYKFKRRRRKKYGGAFKGDIIREDDIELEMKLEKEDEKYENLSLSF